MGGDGGKKDHDHGKVDSQIVVTGKGTGEGNSRTKGESHALTGLPIPSRDHRCIEIQLGDTVNEHADDRKKNKLEIEEAIFFFPAGVINKEKDENIFNTTEVMKDDQKWLDIFSYQNSGESGDEANKEEDGDLGSDRGQADFFLGDNLQNQESKNHSNEKIFRTNGNICARDIKQRELWIKRDENK